MNQIFALSYAETRRVELAASGYDVSFRHLSLQPAEQRTFAGQGQMWLVVDADKPIRVTSDTGVYYPASKTLREQMHEHTGQIIVGNNAPTIAQAQFVVITWQFGAQPDRLAEWLSHKPPTKP